MSVPRNAIPSVHVIVVLLLLISFFLESSMSCYVLHTPLGMCVTNPNVQEETVRGKSDLASHSPTLYTTGSDTLALTREARE